MKKIILAITLMMISACSSYQIPESPELSVQQPWALMPMENLSNSPLASKKVEQLLSSQLFARGVSHVLYPQYEKTDLQSILDDSLEQRKAKEWLVNQNVQYVITGSVDEWNYKSGLDGEPAVGITLEVKSKQTGETLWKASGSRAGWGRESLSGSGLDVIEKLLSGLQLQAPQNAQ